MLLPYARAFVTWARRHQIPYDVDHRSLLHRRNRLVGWTIAEPTKYEHFQDKSGPSTSVSGGTWVTRNGVVTVFDSDCPDEDLSRALAWKLRAMAHYVQESGKPWP
jgi:hypothetical protein